MKQQSVTGGRGGRRVRAVLVFLILVVAAHVVVVGGLWVWARANGRGLHISVRYFPPGADVRFISEEGDGNPQGAHSGRPTPGAQADALKPLTPTNMTTTVPREMDFLDALRLLERDARRQASWGDGDQGGPSMVELSDAVGVVEPDGRLSTTSLTHVLFLVRGQQGQAEEIVYVWVKPDTCRAAVGPVRDSRVGGSVGPCTAREIMARARQADSRFAQPCELGFERHDASGRVMFDWVLRVVDDARLELRFSATTCTLLGQ